MEECVLIRKEFVDQALANIPAQGKHLLEPLRALAAAKKLPLMGILEDMEVTNEAEVHLHEGDLWIGAEGEVEFIYGGEMVNSWLKQNPDGSKDSREIKAKEIKGGMKEIIRPGDILWIPACQPHVHNADKPGRLYIIKVPSIQYYIDFVPELKRFIDEKKWLR